MTPYEQRKHLIDIILQYAAEKDGKKVRIGPTQFGYDLTILSKDGTHDLGKIEMGQVYENKRVPYLLFFKMEEEYTINTLHGYVKDGGETFHFYTRDQAEVEEIARKLKPIYEQHLRRDTELREMRVIEFIKKEKQLPEG